MILGASKSIQLHFSVTSVLSASPVHTICDLIYAPIRMRDHLSVLFVAKHLLANMIGRDMKDSIRERRNLSAGEIWHVGDSGDVAGDSLAQMLSGAISDLKLAGFVSNHYLTKKLMSIITPIWGNSTNNRAISSRYHSL